MPTSIIVREWYNDHLTTLIIIDPDQQWAFLAHATNLTTHYLVRPIPLEPTLKILKLLHAIFGQRPLHFWYFAHRQDLEAQATQLLSDLTSATADKTYTYTGDPTLISPQNLTPSLR